MTAELSFWEKGRARARRLLAHLGAGPISSLAFRHFRRPTGPESPVPVHLLVSSRTWHAGVLAAMSLELHSGRKWRFTFHDDGTVSPGSREYVRSLFAPCRFIPREEADRTVRNFLSGHPVSLRHRGNHNLFLKFFDTLAYLEADRFVVLDSDVIFFKRPAEILDWVDSGSRECHYNEDTKEKFCIPRVDIERELPVKMLARFNSGLVLMPREAMRLDLADRLLAAFETTAHAPQFFEQTLYGLMGSTNRAGGSALPTTYNISWGYLRAPGSVCRHYVGDFKHDLLYIEGAPMLLLSLLRGNLSAWISRD